MNFPNEQYGLVPGINMTSMLFCRHGGIITPVTSGQNSDIVIPELTISVQYFEFLLTYEMGEDWQSSDEWRYAHDLGDGVITIAAGVVLRDRDGNYLLGKDVYDKYMEMAKNGELITEEQAREITEMRLEKYIDEVNEKAKESEWILSQNQFDALVDMTWNLGSGSLKYNASNLIATGNLSNEDIVSMLKKEILETCAAEIDGKKQWLKNLVERRLDVVRIAQNSGDAYTRNYFEGNWNEEAEQFLIDNGLDESTINKYPIQKTNN